MNSETQRNVSAIAIGVGMAVKIVIDGWFGIIPSAILIGGGAAGFITSYLQEILKMKFLTKLDLIVVLSIFLALGIGFFLSILDWVLGYPTVMGFVNLIWFGGILLFLSYTMYVRKVQNEKKAQGSSWWSKWLPQFKTFILWCLVAGMLGFLKAMLRF